MKSVYSKAQTVFDIIMDAIKCVQGSGGLFPDAFDHPQLKNTYLFTKLRKMEKLNIVLL